MKYLLKPIDCSKFWWVHGLERKPWLHFATPEFSWSSSSNLLCLSEHWTHTWWVGPCRMTTNSLSTSSTGLTSFGYRNTGHTTGLTNSSRTSSGLSLSDSGLSSSQTSSSGLTSSLNSSGHSRLTSSSDSDSADMKPYIEDTGGGHEDHPFLHQDYYVLKSPTTTIYYPLWVCLIMCSASLAASCYPSPYTFKRLSTFT